MPAAVRRADHVLADSDNTRRDLVERLGVPAERVTVAYPGIGAAFRPVREPARLAAVRQRYGLHRPFVLGVGTLEPRKDWPLLVDAFERAGPALANHQLVIAGGAGWDLAPIAAAAEAAGERVRLLGFVPDDDLPALYSLADAFAYPSVYEGFGLPPLEAMACATPTVVSDASCLPEVVGDGGRDRAGGRRRGTGGGAGAAGGRRRAAPGAGGARSGAGGSASPGRPAPRPPRTSTCAWRRRLPWRGSRDRLSCAAKGSRLPFTTG